MENNEAPIPPQMPDKKGHKENIKPEQVAKVLLLAICGVVLVALSTYASLSFLRPAETQTASVAEATPSPDPFADVLLEARAAYVFDIAEDTPLFALNAEAQLPLASVTKLMTALIATLHLAEDAVIEINLNALLEEGDNGFNEGDQFYMRNLLAYTLLESSNDGAYALAEAAGLGVANYGESTDDALTRFVAAMNGKARELGLIQTYFLNPTGLDTSKQISGGYGSARDMAALVTHLVEEHQNAIEATRHSTLELDSLTNGVYTAENTNAVVGDIPGLIASKTGFTDLAGGNLVVAYDAELNHPVVIVVLGSTEEGRFRDVKKLISATREALHATTLNKEVSTVQ